jgi:GTP cyclohydrolase II
MAVPNQDSANAALLRKIDRFLVDLRRGIPVVIVDQDEMAFAVLSSELANAAALEDFARLGPGPTQVLLTHNRAKTLKIRLYTPEAVAIAVDGERTLELIHHLSDPSRDLSHPLMGPFSAEREALSEAQFAALKVNKLAGLLPSALCKKIELEDGQEASSWAEDNGLLCLSASILMQADQLLAQNLKASEGTIMAQVTGAKVPLADAPATRIIAFRSEGLFGGGPEHIAIIIGEPDLSVPTLVRLHSECFTGDLLGSLKCDCGDQLRGSIAEAQKAGGGIVLYLAQEGRGIGLMNKLRAYHLQDLGFDTVEANLRLGFESDERLFECAAIMLQKLGVHQVRLMTNNPDKVAQLESHGIHIVERVQHAFPSNQHNEQYLSTKKNKSGHLL